MNVTFTSLEALVLKATNESLASPDSAAVEAFYSIMRESSEGPQLAAQALATRVHSSNGKEALLALEMLERCLRRGDPRFLAEVGKFRFLNELIMLVSPKYFANRTDPEVKKRILQLFHCWSNQYQSKFKVAYDMLKNQGVLKEPRTPLPLNYRNEGLVTDQRTPLPLHYKNEGNVVEHRTPLPLNYKNEGLVTDQQTAVPLNYKNDGKLAEPCTPVPLSYEITEPKAKGKKSVIFEDDEKSKLLQKLLQSKKPEDLQHANRLIKTMVREDERKSEADNRSVQDVLAALDSAELLREMLQHAQDPTPDEEQLIQEVHANCARMLPALHQLASANISNDNLGDILHASDTIAEVLTKHKTYLQRRKARQCRAPVPSRATINTESLLDFAGAARAQGDPPTNVKSFNKTSLDELGDIFTLNGCSSASPTVTTRTMSTNIMPVSILEADEVAISGSTSLTERGWGELDSLGEELLKQSLPDTAKRLDGFTSKISKKIPMNCLEKSTGIKNSTQCNTVTTTSNNLLDLDFFTKKYEDQAPSATSCQPDSTDDLMLDISTNITEPKDKPIKEKTENTVVKIDSDNTIVTSNCSQIELKSPIEDTKLNDMLKEMKVDEVKTLNDINISLKDVRPSRLSPVRAFEEDNGLAVILHFCRDRPRLDVNVIVVSTTSKKSSPIENYKFQAFVPKGCKVRLLQQSADKLPAVNPFIPPPAVTQLMLIARPPDLPTLCLKFVITYTSDGEPHSEIGEVKQFPLDYM